MIDFTHPEKSVLSIAHSLLTKPYSQHGQEKRIMIQYDNTLEGKYFKMEDDAFRKVILGRNYILR